MKLSLLLLILFATACSGVKKISKKNKLDYRITSGTRIKTKSSGSCKKPTAYNEEIDFKISNLSPSPKGQQFNFNFLDANISEALMELSMESGISIVFSEAVAGVISLSIINKTFEESLQMIAKTGAFEYKKNDNYYYVGIPNKSEDSWDELLYSENYRLKYIKAEVLIKSIDLKLASFIKSDSQKNKIFIRSPRQDMKEILEHIKVLDQPRQQIKIQLTILELSKKGSSFIGKKFNTGTATDYEPQKSIIPTLLSKSKYLNFLYSIKALSQRGLAKVRATPTIITIEDKPAMFKTTNKTLLNAPNIRSTSKAEFIESGTLFQIIPHIVNDSTIRLKIKDSYSSTYNPDTFNINEHKVDTEVEVKKGESLLIGGMIYNRKEKVLTKVPVLGDLPLIGSFFKNKAEKTEVTEVLFSIRPQVQCAFN